MKKIVIISLLLLMSASLTGCGKNDKTASEEKSVKTTILDWLGGGQSTECKLDTPEGQIVIRAKNDKVRFDGVPVMYGLASGEGLGTNLTVGEMMYMWGDKKGMAIDMSAIPKIEGEKKTAKDSWQDMVSVWQKAGFKYECKNLSLSDDYFTPPTNIEIVDLTKEIVEGGGLNLNLEE